MVRWLHGAIAIRFRMLRKTILLPCPAVNRATLMRKRVVVLGGGITGLAAALRLIESDESLDVTLIEARDRLGGVLETVHRDGYLIERSADNFITTVPAAIELCRRIGFANQLIPTSSQERGAMVVHRGRLVRVPAGFMLMAPARAWPLVTTPLLSPLGKLRLAAEYFVARRQSDADESLASFSRRRLGNQVFERIVQPLVSGIYTADPEKLSMRATLPRFVEMERQWGSLVRGARRAPTGESDLAGSGARYGLFVAPREGMSSMVAAIAARLPPETVRLGCRAEQIAREADGSWSVRLSAGNGESATLKCAAIVVALAAPAAAGLLRPLDGELAGELAQIEYAGTAIVSLGLRRDQVAHPLNSFGFVVPAVEKRRILAASFSSIKYPGRAPQGSLLVRVFLGGACQQEMLDLDDETLRRIAWEELAALIGARGRPEFVEVTRWPGCMPQYHVGHLDRVARIEAAAARLPNLALAGSAYRGVGIGHCVASGEEAAERIVESLRAPA
jgi:protoporphyrinogen/coproporphyrinogen III oxidase